MTTKVSSDMVSDDVKRFERTIVIANPTNNSTYTITNAVRNPFELTHVNYNHDNSSGTATTPFSLTNGVTPMADYGTMTTVDGQVTQSVGTPGEATNQFAEGGTLSLTTGTVGANCDYLVVTFWGELL